MTMMNWKRKSNVKVLRECMDTEQSVKYSQLLMPSGFITICVNESMED